MESIARLFAIFVVPKAEMVTLVAAGDVISIRKRYEPPNVFIAVQEQGFKLLLGKSVRTTAMSSSCKAASTKEQAGVRREQTADCFSWVIRPASDTRLQRKRIEFLLHVSTRLRIHV